MSVGFLSVLAVIVSRVLSLAKVRGVEKPIASSIRTGYQRFRSRLLRNYSQYLGGLSYSFGNVRVYTLTCLPFVNPISERD